MAEDITVQVDGRDYTGWKSVSVRRALATMAATFSLAAADRWQLNNEDWVIYPGKEIRILLGGESLLWGYVDSVSPSISPGSHEISIMGRDRTGDLVDCSVAATPGTWRNVTLQRLLQDLAEPFGITVRAETGTGSRFSKFSVKQGESVHEAMSRAAKLRSVLLLSGTEGELLITNAGLEDAADELEIGRNVLQANAGYDYSQRFQTVTVKGQNGDGTNGWNKASVSINGSARDEEITRYRPKVVRASGALNKADSQFQAAWEVNVRAAKSFTANVSVRGFRQTNGALWVPGPQVLTRLPELLLNSWMVIAAVEYRLGEQSGAVTNMQLTRADAFEPNPSATLKPERGNGWAI